MAKAKVTKEVSELSDGIATDFGVATESSCVESAVECVGVVPEGYASAEEMAEELGMTQIKTDVSKYRNETVDLDLDLGA